MKNILLATGNRRKIQEAKNTLVDFGIIVEPIKIDINEIQHNDPAEITKAKAISAFEVLHKPVVVSDTSWEIPALSGFPGGYMKDVAAWLDAEDWIKLMSRHEDKTIYCHEHVAYFDGDEIKHFQSIYKGRFVDKACGGVRNGESFERAVVMHGDLTMAEQSDKNGIASAGQVLKHWQMFGQWFKNKDD